MLKLGYNEATCKENSTVENDLLMGEKYGYDYIELRLDMLQEYLKTEEWEKLVELFTFGCKVAQQIGNPYIIVVPTVTNEICTRNEKETFDDSVKVLNELADIAEPYGVKLSFEPIGDKKWCVNSVRQALEIVNAVNRDSVGLTVDCINVYLHDKCADVDFIRKIPKEKLFVFHINDCEDLPLGILDHCHRLMPGLPSVLLRRKLYLYSVWRLEYK